MLVCSKKFFSEYMFGRGLDNSTPAEKLNIRVASVALGIFTLGIVHAICAAIFLTRQVKAIPQTPSPNIRLQSERFHQSPNKLERKKDETKEDFQIKKICKSKDRKKFPKQKTHQRVTQETRFKQHDYDYTDYSEEDIRKLLDAMNCCAFPKLALILAEKYRLDLHEACKQINAAGNKIDPNNIPATLTLEEVLKYR